MSKKKEDSKIHVCYADDMHPYNCDGVFGGRCIHCEGVVSKTHNPDTCMLCHYLDEDFNENDPKYHE